MSNALIRPLAPETPVFREAPHNLEAEQALLGAILVNNEAIDRVSTFLKPGHFYDALHARIYEAASKLILSGKRATPITLKTFFQADPPVGELPVPQYLGRLAANATTIINAEDYGRTVYDLAIRRQLIQIGETMVNTAYDSPIDAPPSIQIEGAEQQLYELAETGKYGTGFEPFSSALTDAIDMAANAYRRDGGLSGLATGFTDLDHRMGGLQPSDLIIIAGRPAMGKTALATNIAYHVAKTYRPGGDAENALDGAVVGFFSLEMSAEQLATRIISEQAYIPSERIRRGRIDADEFDRIVEVSQELQHLPLYIDQTGGISVAQLAARARRLKRQRGLGFIVVDYLQLLSGSSKRAAEGRVQEVSEITTGLKALAKELHVPVLALSQLSRQVEQREDKRPQLADLRESGSIEQDADVVLFVFREEYYLERSQPRENTEEHQKWQLAHGHGDGEGRRDHRQAAARPDRHGDAAIHSGVHEVQQSRRGGAPAGAARVKPERPPEAASSEREDGASDTAILTIDLDALTANYRRLRDLASPAECAAVVKADAYGLGMALAAPALARAGCKTFFVATLGEARALRALLPDPVIYVFAGLMPATAEIYRAYDLRPVLNSAEEIAEWASFCAARGEKLACAVHIDSGMNRLGLSAEDVDRVADARELWQAMTLSLVMSHLACADEPRHPKSETQRKSFDRLRAQTTDGAGEPRQLGRHPAWPRLCL